MLAQNFKSPTELKILDHEFAALVTTLGMLERGELTHLRSDRGLFPPANAFTGHFNMNTWSAQADCGTVCCIGGTAELIGHFEFSDRSHGVLSSLFFPPLNLPVHYRDITPEQAARALRSFLTTGKPNWHDAVR